MDIGHHQSRAILAVSVVRDSPRTLAALSYAHWLFFLLTVASASTAGCGTEHDTDSDSEMVVGEDEPSSPGATAGSGDPLAAFVGEWVFASGTRTSDCDGEDTMTEPVEVGTKAYTVERGPQGGLVIRIGGCGVDFDLENGGAVVQPNQACKGMARGTDITIGHLFVAWTLDPLSGSKLRSNLTRLSTAGNASGEVSCLIRENGNLQRR